MPRRPCRCASTNGHNDAHGIAQIVRVGWYREVVVKSMDNHTLRAMLSARAHLVAQSVTLANSIRGLLKVFGLVVRRAKGGRFDDLVLAAIADQPDDGCCDDRAAARGADRDARAARRI